jgi:2,3-bisphosphoglycerate-independent phosphoglycerate mutase
MFSSAAGGGWPNAIKRDLPNAPRKSALDKRKFRRYVKYVIIHGDGMADWPCKELGGQTPLKAARKPNVDLTASRDELGLVATIPPGMAPGSDVGTMTMLGYDSAHYHTGRAPIEGASQGIELGPTDVVFRMNLVSFRSPPAEVAQP